jgi:hypothetical protein
MSYNIFEACKWWMITALFALGVQFAFAGNVPLVSGSYEVVQKNALGSQEQIRLRIHLVNQGPADLSIQRMTLWDFPHPAKGGSNACALTIRAHASADTTQEFTLQRSEYQLWRRGLRPRLVLRMGGGPGNAAGKATTNSTVVVRLDRISGQEAK